MPLWLACAGASCDGQSDFGAFESKVVSDLPANLKSNPLLSRWIAVDGDDRIAIHSGKVELGQGATAAIAAIAAIELGVRFDQVEIVPADTRISPDEGYTAGSFSVEHGGAAMRYAAATVRELFAQAAAEQLKVPQEEIEVADGLFRRRGHNEAVSYWQLRREVSLDRSALELPLPKLRGGSVDRLSMQRPDLQKKLAGAAFIQDMIRPGMLYGRVLRPPHPRDRLVAFDEVAVAALAGVTLVRDGSFAGVVAKRDDDAVKALALAAKTAIWQRGAELPDCNDTNGWMDNATAKSTTFLEDQGAPPAPLTRHSARYSRPYLAHASIGPSCAVAEWAGERLTVWSHSQGIFPLQRQLARVFGLPPAAVDVTHVPGAGCYGHNGADDVALDAALLARAAKAPVMCLWSRSDELSWSPHGAAMRMQVLAGLDDHGRIAEWFYEVWSPPHVARPGFGEGINLLAARDLETPHAPSADGDVPLPQGGGARNAVPLYRLGKRTITHHLLPQGPLRSSALRSLGAHGNIFAIESFMDELALLAARDAVAFRLDHLDDPRGRAVIEAAAKAAGWDPSEPGGDGEGRGIGFARYKNLGAYCATVVRVQVEDRVHLVSVHAAVDSGEVIHRDGLINQIEGGIIQAASWTLKEAVGWTADGFAVRSWADYPILSFKETPAIETIVVEPAGAPSLGAGECAAGPIAAAIANAVAHALGIRVRDMPLTSERIASTINAPEAEDTP
jgi:nicotinate dehydrogenase subunit B